MQKFLRDQRGSVPLLPMLLIVLGLSAVALLGALITEPPP